ncbi:phosphatidylserine decarboxylase proenzyme, mitochondrial-like isoform X1 [Amphiura filiformis]|uniref:phosphatidylserine decarboxylase proenzyme, mitochondrial-like isoform X1 n=1 Tax=Amphiura filiformis TaxID=82378 RepID=UPI003B214C6C
MGMEALFILGQFPFLLSVFILLEVWYFIYTNLCPFLNRIPYFEQLNPCKACLRIGFHLLPLAKFLALPDDEQTLNEGEVYARAAGEESAEELDSSDDEEDYVDDSKTLPLLGLRHVGIKTLDDPTKQVNFYKYLPLRMTSRVWGKVNDVNVPTPLRGPMFRLYSWLFDCNLSEALIEDLSYYQNLGQFFRREIKPDVRPVSPHHSIVSPCDGRILHFGKVENSLLEQVKGVTYSLKTFLGPNTWNSDHHTKRSIKEIADEDYHKSLGVKPDNCLYHCVIYLAPGDYHRFHSPVNWNIQYRRHFPGCLLSVNPGIARWVRGLFSFNERVVLYGDWEHGFFSYTAVGATNVGSINLKFDQEVVTNVRGRYKEGSYQDRSYSVPTSSASSHDSTDDAQSASSGIGVNKGECIGEFNLGSTIVMVFEAPKDFQFSVAPGERVKLGEKMGTL